MVEPIIKHITKPISLITTKEINSLWFAELEIEKTAYIAPECYVEFLNELYISKKIHKIIDRGKISFEVKLHHNMIELNNKSIIPFTYTNETPTQMFTTILTGTRWSVGTINITSTSTVKNDKRITCLAALMLVARQFGGEIYFNCVKQNDGSFTRTIDLKTTIGNQTTKPMVRYDKNSDHIERIENTEKLCTRLYIYGKDNLTLASVNNGLEYLDSTHTSDYPEPIETTVYTQIDDATRLLNYGQIYLGLYEHPLFSYILDVFDKSIFPLWTMETFNIGDKIRVYNKDIDLNVDCRIQVIAKDLTKGTMIIELENLEDKITDFLALLDYYIDHPDGGYYDNNPFVPPELPPYNPPDKPGEPIPIPMAGMYLIKADTYANGDSLRHIARKKIVVDSLGQFWCVYARSDGANEQIYCARSTNGQVWTETILTVSDPGADTYKNFINFGSPVICIGSNDVVYVVFRAVNVNDIYSTLFVKYDGSWSAQVEIATGNQATRYGFLPAIAIDSNDLIHVLITSRYGGGSVWHIGSSDEGANWSAPVAITFIGILHADNAIAFEITPDNKLHVGICAIVAGMSSVRYVQSSDAGATWNAEVNITASVQAYSSDTVSFAADSLNNIHAIFCEWVHSWLWYTKCDAVTGIWSTPIVLSNKTYEVNGGTISVDNNDNLYVVWSGWKPNSPSGYRQLKLRICMGGFWEAEIVQTTNYPSKRFPTLVQAQFPIVNEEKYNISRNGFIVIFTIDDDIWIWFNCDWHI